MKEILKLGFILFLITAVSAGLLGFANEMTKEPIAKQVQQTKEEAMKQTLPEADKYEGVEVDLPEESSILEVNAGYKGDTLEGFAVKVAPKGFGGAIEIMVGVSKDGILQGVKILSHSETPGLGANAESPAFTSQYEGKSGQLKVVKTTPGAEDEIQAITGATITSKAVTTGINEVLNLIEHRVDTDNNEIIFDFN
ncbi:RnfABCDGE type electron transport complex subunit G [Defluviitalea saccharophila]|uniref:Ion-translocating oxidoreductase complex subunit G n=1 Tax=Defluviitalea saccharophila TaxID=879970 RepID=A0ABZ2Y6G4_9FIRM|nr:RnfABCDGE type electron transport complex subunit G [Candidatus Epulonipiscium sp.]